MNRRLPLLFVLMLVGCNVSTEFSASPAGQEGPSSSAGPDPRTSEYALWAARAENAYPRGVEPTEAMRLAVVVDRQTGDFKLYNFSAQGLKDAKVWINRQYARPLEALPSGHGIVLPRPTFHNAYSISLGKDQTPATKVEVQQGETLISVQGPAFEATR